MANILRLPDETLLQIFRRLPAKTLTVCGLTCRRFQRVADQSIWRQRCLDDFQHWDPRHNIRELASKPVSDIDWRVLYISRYDVDIRTQKAINGIIESQVGRIGRVEAIIPFGDDTREVLLRNINASESEPDVLARRWYSRAVLGRLQRQRAIQIWVDLAKGGEVDLVEALHAFDVFVRCEKSPEISEIKSLLGNHAERCRQSTGDWDSLNTRERATALAKYLIDDGAVGLKPGHRHSDVRNSFIGHALTNNQHSSLQLISTAIYCAIGKLLQLDARVCGFPHHVLAMVFPTAGMNLEDESVVPDASGSKECNNCMFLDPFQSSVEKPITELLESLRRLGTVGQDAEKALRPSTDTEILIRCARNIMAAVQDRVSQELIDNESGINHLTALYGALWCFFITHDSNAGIATQAWAQAQRRTILPHIVFRMENHFPFDAHLLSDIVCPLIDSSHERQMLQIRIRAVIDQHTLGPEVKPRENVASSSVRYRIGQLFHHSRYHYQGVIYGWDVECEASEHWIRNMGVTDLERGKEQSFYHILADDGSTRYVAEDNIEIIQPSHPASTLLDPAGQHFKRWDPIARAFVSNVRHEYPDD